MIPPKNNWCVRTLIICCVALSIATSNAVPKEKMLRIPWRHGGYLLISTVDWYKEPPENFSSAGHVAEIYHGLVKVVPRSLHSEAIALLANTDVLELTKEQAKHFGFQADPDSVLQSLTHAIAERRRNNQERNADVKAGRDPYVSAASAKEELETGRRLQKQYDAEIKQHQEWIGRLKPYLIRGVAFFYEQAAFDGQLAPKGLTLTFGGAFEVKRVERLTMRKMPAVAYLPYKPPHVYTEMSLMD